MRVLVTGGLGYIGGSIVKAFQLAKHEVGILDNETTASTTAAKLNCPDTWIGDIGNPPSVHQVLDAFKPDVIVHCAASAMIEDAEKRKEFYVENNVVKHLNFLNCLPDKSRIIYSGTSGVYGEPVKVPMTETHPVKPINWYSRTKWWAEVNLSLVAKAKEFQYIVFRYFSVTGSGWGVYENRPYDEHVVTALFKMAETGGTFTLQGDGYKTPDGSTIRDFMSVKDLAKAHVLGADALMSGKITHDIFNLGTGEGITMKELHAMVCEVTGVKIPLMVGPPRQGDPSRLVCDPSWAERHLGWERKESLRDALGDLWDMRRARKA